MVERLQHISARWCFTSAPRRQWGSDYNYYLLATDRKTIFHLMRLSSMQKLTDNSEGSDVTDNNLASKIVDGTQKPPQIQYRKRHRHCLAMSLPNDLRQVTLFLASKCTIFCSNCLSRDTRDINTGRRKCALQLGWQSLKLVDLPEPFLPNLQV